MTDLDRALAALVNQVRWALRNLIMRGAVTGVTQNRMQTLQVTGFAGEVRDNIEHFEPAGFTSNPMPGGAEPVLLSIGGDRSHTVAVVVADRRNRPQDVPPGGVCVYAPADGIARIYLLPGGKVRIEGTDIEMHATHSLSWDVDGYGRRITSQGGGAYEDRTWQEGAVVTSVTGPIHPPEGPG